MVVLVPTLELILVSMLRSVERKACCRLDLEYEDDRVSWSLLNDRMEVNVGNFCLVEEPTELETFGDAL